MLQKWNWGEKNETNYSGRIGVEKVGKLQGEAGMERVGKD